MQGDFWYTWYDIIVIEAKRYGFSVLALSIKIIYYRRKPNECLRSCKKT